MDYDDNDFQGQNHQLAGEGSSKFSSVLHPYALPKLDFDDSLRGHLRFDSLVENEVFLGIPSQEDNQWIEDFSQGTSGIEFSSSAAKSCSISKHINVWSEAASYESVEMLLKSVGSSNVLDPDAISDKCGLTVTTENMGIDRKCDDSYQREADTSANESLNYETQQDPFVSEKQICNIDSSGQNVTASIGNLDGRKVPDKESDVCFESINSSSKDKFKEVEEHNAQSQEANMDDQVSSKIMSAICAYSMDAPHRVSSEVESFGKPEVEKEDNFLGSDSQTDTRASDNKSEKCIFSALDNQPLKQGGESIMNLTGVMVACSSAEMLKETLTIENIKGGSIQICKEKHFEQFDSTGMERGVTGSLDRDKRVGSSSSSEGVEDNVVIADGPEFDTTTANNPALDVTAGPTNLVSCDSYDGIPSLSGRGVSADGVNDCNEEHKNLSVGFTCLDKNEEMKIEVLRDASLSTLKESSHVAYKLGLVSEVGKDTDQTVPITEVRYASNQSERVAVAYEVNEQCSKKLETSPPPCDLAIKDGDGAETVAFESHGEASVERNQKVAPLEVADAVLTPNKREVVTEPTIVSLVDSCCNSGQKDHEDNKTITSSGVNNLGQAVHNTNADTSNEHTASFGLVHSSERDANHILEAGGNSADSDKPNCNSPNVISCIKPTNSDGDKQEALKGMMVENVPVSEASTGVDGQVQSISLSVRGNGNSNEESSFTFEVSPTVGLTDAEKPTILVGSSPTSGGGQLEPKRAEEISCGLPQGSDGMIRDGGAKVTPTRKPRHGSQMEAKTAKEISRGTPQGSDEMIAHRGAKKGKENAKKGKHVKETTTAVKQLERGDKSRVSISPLQTGQIVQCEEQKPNGNFKSIGSIPYGVISVPTSNLSDPKTYPSVLFQQPFTDVQQVQLGAQILVYGSLIQGAAPDGASMVSAFGPSDGTRHAWEPAWRACLERFHDQKSHANNSETPAQSRSGTQTSHQASKQGPLQHKVVSSPGGRASPLLGYHQPLSPLHPKQAPPLRNFVGHNSSLLSQASFTGPWVASPQNSSFDAGVHFSRFPVKESFPPVSATKHVSPIPMAHTAGPNISAGIKASPGQHSADLKARKRKSVPATMDLGQISCPQSKIESESNPAVNTHSVKKVRLTKDLGQISMLARSRTELVSAPLSHFSTSVTVTSAACSASEGNSGKILSPVSPTSSNGHLQKGDQTVENKDTVSDERPNKVEEAMVQTEEAISRCQNVWSKLDKQKNSASVSEIEAKLASAAVAISAAASVAKAAAEAAKIASNAAVQAKLMADEAFFSSENEKPTQNANNSLPSVGNCSSSIIIAAREAARRRVKAASAASKHAENLDAIVKAAELTVEAVSQTRKILSMGDPLSLSELVESVPEVQSVQGFILNNVNRDLSNSNGIEQVLCPSAKQPKGGLSDKEMHMSPLPRDFSRVSKDDHMRVVDVISSPVRSSDKDSRGRRGHRASELVQTMLVVPEPEFGLRPTSGISRDESEIPTGLSKQNSITKGCFVEVLKEGGNCKAAWFSANVLSLADGRAFVSYTDLQLDEGSDQLKELVPLEDDNDKPPRIRIAHPITTMRSQGTRKRPRDAITDYSWAVGDRADARMQNCWREGIVIEKKNETTLTVHFPVEGEMSVVRAWDLRPTLIWKDGEWIEWPKSRGGISSQGNTPQEKRLKPGSPVIEGKREDKDSKDINLGEYANKKIIDVGNNDAVENNLDGLRRPRTGLQKGVNIGVPKPGKKTKFMEVNKHFVSHSSSMDNLAKDSVKFARYLMPRGSRERKNSSKVDANDKEADEGGTLPRKNRLLSSAKAALSDATTTDSVSNDAKRPGKVKLVEFGFCSDTEEAVEGPMLFSSQVLPPDSSVEMPSSYAKSERVNKGKHAEEAGGKSTNVEVRAKSIPNVVETRRSHRRIQPTSRLLEGLQSSLIASKIPPSFK